MPARVEIERDAVDANECALRPWPGRLQGAREVFSTTMATSRPLPIGKLTFACVEPRKRSTAKVRAALASSNTGWKDADASSWNLAWVLVGVDKAEQDQPAGEVRQNTSRKYSAEVPPPDRRTVVQKGDGADASSIRTRSLGRVSRESVE